jgi:hypothetical protein
MRLIGTVTILLLFSSCYTRLKNENLKTWFYGVPIYKDVSYIRSELISDNRFFQQESTDTTKKWYMYTGTIQKPYLPKGAEKPDSAKIEFSYFHFDTAVNKSEDRLDITIVKLLQIEYFYANTDDIEKMFTIAYEDLKQPFVEGHDITTEQDGKEIAAGKNITYQHSKDFSQDLEVTKRTHPNGTKSVRIILKIGE